MERVTIENQVPNALFEGQEDSELIIDEGMSFHILSWLMGMGQGEFFRSNCVLSAPDGAEILTETMPGPIVA